MVYLNKIVSVDIKKLEKLILEKVNDAIKNELYYVDNIENKVKETINRNIVKEIKNQIKKDNFLYRIMDDNKCVFKHKRGKHDGKFCCNNITKNGDKKEYLCRRHNKSHIPKHRKDINKQNNNINENISISKSIESIKNNINSTSNSDAISTSNSSFNRADKSNSNKIKKHKNNYIIKNIYVNKFNLNNFKNIINKYNNVIICKYSDDNCHNVNKYGYCDFKHIHKNISIKEFLVDNNKV